MLSLSKLTREGLGALARRNSLRLATDFPVGQFLFDGGWKNVFKVWSARAAREEAISVLDMEDNEEMVAQELRASVLTTALVRKRICPNFVQTYGVLRTSHDPKDLWSCSDQEYLTRRAARARDWVKATAETPEGDYLLIRMELCRHGDLESYLRRQPDGLVPEATARDMLFQMCFSLYAAREAHLMRHYGAWVEAVQAPSP
jgi:serine/threonine protein kinase